MRNLEEWLKKPLYENEIISWFKSNNIIIERLLLFKDFISRLFSLVEETYVGYQLIDALELPIIMTNDDNKKHFNWCWKKNISLFEEEKLLFLKEGDHKDLLWNLSNSIFYNGESPEKTKINSEYLVKIFDLSYAHTKSDLDILTELYKKMEKAFIISE